MATNIFVGNLPFSTTSADLEDLFASFGTVIDAKVILDRDTQRSRGFGFVEMESDDEAQKAISELNDSDMDGRRLTVNVARERRDRR